MNPGAPWRILADEPQSQLAPTPSRTLPESSRNVFVCPGMGISFPSVPKSAVVKQPAISAQTYTVYAGLWRVDGNFVSTIRIKNELVVAPLDLTPVLYMSDGTRYELPPVHVPVAGVAFVNINDALAAAPPKVAGHVSEFGSAGLHWQYTSAGHVAASVEMLNVPQSLIFIAPFNGIDSTMTGRQRLEGLWWRHDAGFAGYISVANMTDSPVEVHLGAAGAHGSPQPSATVELPAHTTQVLHLNDLLALPPESPENLAGGIQVEYNGPMNGVMVTGGLENAGEGYSANMPFWFHEATKDKAAQISYASVGMMAGQPDPMMGFPAKTVFTPYLALRNTTDHPLAVGLTVNYMAGGAPASQAAPSVLLAPFESRQADLKPVLAALGLANFNGNLNLEVSFTGRGGDLVVATGSVDQTGTYVFEVEPRGIGQSLSMVSALWTTANGFDTMWNLLNPTDKAEDLVGIFYYGDGSGSYKLPIHLAAHGSTMIDMAMLKMSQQPDADGHLIPASEQVGSAVFQSAKGRTSPITVFIDSGVYNVVTATCGGGCINCCGYSNFALTPSNFYMGVGQVMPCGAQGTYCDGSQDDLTAYVANWISGDTTILAVDSSGNVTGVAPGGTYVEAQFAPLNVYSGQICGQGYQPTCPQGQPSVDTNTSVVLVQVTSVSLPSDQVSVALQGPSGSSGTLTVTWNGPSGNPDIANTSEGVGSYTFNPSLSGLATGQYTGVTAQWLSASGSNSTSFYVLGNYRHSQYNTPYESSCSGSSSSAYEVNATTCAYQASPLTAAFISQSWLNGSGITASAYYGYSTEQDAQYCLNNGYLPSDASGKAFAFVSQIQPACSGYSLSNSTIARAPGDANLGCGDQVLIVGLGSGAGTTKTVTDVCPICEAGGQLDNYTTQAACAPNSFSDLGNFATI